ncbi:MAG: hypothetical protein A2W98_04840 [Bacteroidetes bacterium GWF2_33_38]|nr:MAG: hypothetical protein A2W98_04840 [Bacteroidetes bacterium GWF2_33_38]OFY76147.1 MAG: hypothetical protein A2265_07695 [Bacteroidetes bacterium RIFOXYA12_FULL_33_9]
MCKNRILILKIKIYQLLERIPTRAEFLLLSVANATIIKIDEADASPNGNDYAWDILRRTRVSCENLYSLIVIDFSIAIAHFEMTAHFQFVISNLL